MKVKTTYRDIEAWHLVPISGYLRYDMSHVKVYPGLKLNVPHDKVNMWAYGLYAMSILPDEGCYIDNFIVCRVKLSGKTLIRNGGKCGKIFCSEKREVLWIKETPQWAKMELKCQK